MLAKYLNITAWAAALVFTVSGVLIFMTAGAASHISYPVTPNPPPLTIVWVVIGCWVTALIVGGVMVVDFIGWARRLFGPHNPGGSHAI